MDGRIGREFTDSLIELPHQNQCEGMPFPKTLSAAVLPFFLVPSWYLSNQNRHFNQRSGGRSFWCYVSSESLALLFDVAGCIPSIKSLILTLKSLIYLNVTCGKNLGNNFLKQLVQYNSKNKGTTAKTLCKCVAFQNYTVLRKAWSGTWQRMA